MLFQRFLAIQQTLQRTRREGTEQSRWQLLPPIYFGDGRKAFGSVDVIKDWAKPLTSPAFRDRAKPWKVGLHLGLTTSAKVTPFLGPDVSKWAPQGTARTQLFHYNVPSDPMQRLLGSIWIWSILKRLRSLMGMRGSG